MRKHILFLFILSTLFASAVERVSLAQLQGDWAKYTNQTVVITDALVVCGSFYDSLLLAQERLFCPDERALGLADGDSTMYYAIQASNRASSVCLHCRNAYYEVRTGDVIKGLQARVTGPRQLLTGKSVKTRHMPKDKLAKPHKGELRIVGANIENYFADLGGYAHKRTTPAQQAMKTRKLVQALQAMHADIIACCEMQVGNKAPEMLLSELNKGGQEYAFAAMPLADCDRIGGCFLYNTKRVRVCGKPLSAYRDTANHYHARMFALPFEEIATGERFVISLNHLKSKRAGRGNYDTHLKRMQNTDSLLAIAGYADMLPMGEASDYSYSFKGEAGYLDRCFASPSMAQQVVRVRPWHVNADWYYSHGAYKMRDKSMHRYADHEPIVVDIKLH